jgi:uncharacterized protein YjiS (DUF1127 family)
MTTTMRRAMPLALLLGDIGARYFPAKAAAAIRREPTRSRQLHELSDWILRDIGLEREDRMSPEARRASRRLNSIAFW